jgi:DNA-binding winged helix-turn-helix (wHTH) protein/Tol biopolymer transport system component
MASLSERRSLLTTREVLLAEPRPSQYRFGDFVLNVENGFLRRNGADVPLRPKAFEVLKYLVLHRGRLVSKDELAEAIWQNVAVTDNSLAQCLSEIRRALDDDAQVIIRTVARRGYVFEAPPALHVPVVSRRVTPVFWRVAAILVMCLAGGITFFWARGTKPPTVESEPPVALTDYNDSAVAPSLSHDGRMLVFIRGGHFGTTAAPRGQVYVKALPNGTPVQLTRDRTTKDHPIFNPDDSRIVYTALMPGLSWDSWQVPVLGGPPRPFLTNASGVTWLDDRRIAYSTIMGGIHMGIASSTETRGEYRDIYFPPRQDGMAHRSAPSPDRKWLLVVEMKGGTWLPCRLVPMDAPSAGRAVSPPGGQCTSAAWSPDGRWMYFSSNDGGAFHIWRQRYPASVPEQITFGPTEQEGTAITPDGKFLITSMGLQQASIWLEETGGERQLTDEGYATQPIMLPADTRMFYLVRTTLSRGQTSGELWSVDTRSGKRERILPGVAMANYSLSRDGSKVVFTSSANDGGDGIWVADLQHHSPPRHVVSGAELRAFFGEPGEIVYRGEDGRLYRMNEDGSDVRVISTNPVAYLSTVSPDGRWAVVILPQATNGVGTTSLAFMSLRGEKSFDVCNEECSVGPRSFLGVPAFSWSMDGTRLFVNLVHFGKSTSKTVIVPYRSDASSETLWPKGLRFEQDLIETPGATIVNAANTFPASDPGAYLSWKTATQSNLYRIRIPD